MRVLSKLVGSQSVVLAMALSSMLAMVGCASNNSSTGSNITATPTFSPGAGTYTTSPGVAVGDATPGAVLYCTADGSTPTTSSPQCSQPTTVFKSEFLQAIAVAPGKLPSAVASAGYTINLNPVATPTFSPGGGSYTGPQMVAISDSASGANIYYTLDGTSPLTVAGNAPSATATLYAGPVSIAQNATPTVLNAAALTSGLAGSPIATATYAIQPIPPAPAVSGIAPASANAGDPAVTLIVTGTNFVSGATVLWNGVPLTTVYGSATQLTATVPATLIASAGTANVTVTQASGFSGPEVFTINSVTPAVTGLDPAVGPTTGGTSVSIMGNNFTGATAVNFGNALATNVVVNSANSITAVSPAGVVGPVNVTVSAPSGTSVITSADQFTYTNPPTVTGVSPVSGPAAGGTSVTITGTNFTGATAVNFGGMPATNVTVNSATSITATSPAGTGTADVTVVAPGGTSALGTADEFLYGVVTLTGSVVSGALPIKNATVQMYFAGTTGYGVGSRQLETLPSTVTTDAGGNFTLQYACPEVGAPEDQIYLVANGGDSGSGTNNSSIALMTAVGTCSKVPASIVINEVTTVASAYALSAFATINTGGAGGIAVGAPATLTANASKCNAANNWQSTGAETCNYNGLVTAFQAVQNLVSITAGTALTYTPAYKQDLASDANIVNNSTVPTARINALADMLASCVESDGSGCSSSTGLLGAAATTGTPTAGVPPPVTPVDTLQAALNIAQNPGNDVPNLLNLVVATQPYSITSSDAGSSPLVLNGTGAPTDLTLALTFTGAGLGLYPPNVNLSDNNSGIFNGAMGIDAGGNIWVGASISGGDVFLSPQDPNGQLVAEFDALGEPVTPSMQLTMDTPQVPTYGGFDPQPPPGLNSAGAGIMMLAIDPSGNLWTNNGGGFSETSHDEDLLEISAGPGHPVLNNYLADGPTSVTIDAGGNAWFPTTNNAVDEFLAIGKAGVSGGNLSPFVASTTPSYLAFDSGGALWLAASNFLGNDVFQVSTQDASVLYDAFSTISGFAPTTLVADGVGNIYACDPTGMNLDVLNVNAPGASATPANLLVNSYPIATQRACGSQLVLDGQGHIFAVLDSGGGAPSAYQFKTNIDEYTTGGTLISPLANGYTGTSSSEGPTLSADTSNTSAAAPGTSAAIDSSGNLWVLNSDVYGPVNAGITAKANALVEYIGIGAPVVTPMSSALANGALGVRP